MSSWLAYQQHLDRGKICSHYFSCGEQLYRRLCLSLRVCACVCMSVTPFLPCSYQWIFMKLTHWSYKMRVLRTTTGPKVKGHGHRGHSNFLSCPLRGSMPIWPISLILGTHIVRDVTIAILFHVKRSKIKVHRSFKMKVTGVIWNFCGVRSLASSFFNRITSYVAYIQHMRGRSVAHHFQDERSKVKVIWVVPNFWPCPLREFLLIWPNDLIFGIHTTGEGVIGRIVKGQVHMSHLKYLSCPLRGFLLSWSNHFICGMHTTHDWAMCRAPFSGRMVKGQHAGNTMYSLQRTHRGHPMALPKGRGVACLFWVLSLSLSELSHSSFSCCFQYHWIFDCDISIVYSIHVLVFLYLGGQLDKLCFSVRPPSRNELHTDCKLYHVLLLGK